MNIIYKENILTADDFIAFQRKMNWLEEPKEQLDKALKNGLYNIVATVDDEIVGMGRLVGDGAVYFYIQDVFILTKYQGMHIGTEIVNHLIHYVVSNSIPNTTVSVNLMSAKGKEGFYEKIGFVKHPNNNVGAGMEMVIDIK